MKYSTTATKVVCQPAHGRIHRSRFGICTYLQYTPVGTAAGPLDTVRLAAGPPHRALRWPPAVLPTPPLQWPNGGGARLPPDPTDPALSPPPPSASGGKRPPAAKSHPHDPLRGRHCNRPLTATLLRPHHDRRHGPRGVPRRRRSPLPPPPPHLSLPSAPSTLPIWSGDALGGGGVGPRGGWGRGVGACSLWVHARIPTPLRANGAASNEPTGLAPSSCPARCSHGGPAMVGGPGGGGGRGRPTGTAAAASRASRGSGVAVPPP